jgi:DNA polymerase-3 subunit gamma/tau
MTDELYKRYRPKTFKQVLGQPRAVASLQRFLADGRVPHTILFSGPSGCGKTTLARLMADKLGCRGTDLQEINAADFRGIDKVRQIRSERDLSPLGGKCRIYIVDECHRLTGEAQDGFLKLLEDTPEWLYFFLCTTAPNKLLKTIQTRSTPVWVEPLKSADMERLLKIVAKKEEAELSEEVRDRIVDVADGSPRMALVILNQVIGEENEEKRLALIRDADAEAQSIDLCRVLFKGRWRDAAKVLKELDGLDPEAVRLAVLGYASKVLLGSDGQNGERAFRVIDAFGDNFWNSKRAGLIAACWEVFHPEVLS